LRAAVTSLCVCVCVCVCVAKFKYPKAFMKLNLDPVTRHALLRLHEGHFAADDNCSTLYNTNTCN
jgi:hypothetical protein